jgi:type I restriction enzyme S subunit
MAEMRLKGTGVAIPGLNSTQARSLTILVPSQAVAAAFNATTEPLISRILANCNESRTLATTRDLLLPRLMSGELRVKDAERLVETAA